jgi:copper chaperone CopZ
VTARATFKQADVERAVKGVYGAGLQVARVRVSPDGAIDIIIGQPSDDDEDWRNGSPLYQGQA